MYVCMCVCIYIYIYIQFHGLPKIIQGSWDDYAVLFISASLPACPPARRPARPRPCQQNSEVKYDIGKYYCNLWARFNFG